ncbi:uncharacterized protein BCR38DRAFT_447933 [Pseudomassariella vexata]|uniref:Transcription factor domain-containing protein n=1 Tax=Pseudomassariella vexata TaxID=1141098 RepID=A0A1Y2DFP3_9PEZI|nr:uncharacterized protein BCR38DRAFT_447933 [Pseudomassariella vexata]ORY58078.1 hypothetical protein BCR38DRAFT_447933 [Pseudomassariella vexata]
MPYARFFSQQIVSPRRMLQLPPKGSHPIHIARRLLMLGTLLQGIQPSSVGKLAGMSSDYRVVMSRVVNTAARLVRSNDELVSSLEGIECVMMESMYLNNAGNLRRAWLTNRRAMVTAQMMGLHTGSCSPSMMLEAETRNRIDPDCMWFRIVFSDRYLSLMLGLPQGSPENIFAGPEALERCTAMERMERMMAVAAGHILQRNGAQRTDLAVTYKVDKMLQEAAALMLPQCWLMTQDSTILVNNSAQEFKESLRLVNQFTQWHLLVQLHLPYMLLPSSIDQNYDYSKMTAASAGRAIVSQFVSFRSSTSATAYCRGIDLVAFVASTTLCLAHMEARRQQKTDAGKVIGVFQSLQHQRLSDRGLLERTLEIMETMAQKGHDVVAQKISSVLRPLLDIENNSARGVCYETSALEYDKNESQPLGDTGLTFNVLRIQIPYFGTIKIEHCPTVSDYIEPAKTPSKYWLGNPPASQAAGGGLVVLCELISPPTQVPHEGQQGGTISTGNQAAYAFSTAQPVNTDWQAVPSHLYPAGPPQQSEPAAWDQGPPSLDVSDAQEACLLVPGITADVNDWALQGVDMALFSSLIQDSAGPTEIRPQADTQ